MGTLPAKDTMTPRPLAVGYVSAQDAIVSARQRAALQAHAVQEGLGLASMVEDPHDLMTLSELLALTEQHGAVRVLLAAGTAMAARRRSVNDVLSRIGAACTVVADPGPRPGPQMVALDIDGTLVPEGTTDVAQVTADAVRDVLAAGHHVVLASGRSLVGILPIAERLGLSGGWLVASNGAVTARLDPEARDGFTVTDAQTFDVEPVARLARDLMPDVELAVEETGWGYRVTRRAPDGDVNGQQHLVAFDGLWSVPASRVILRAPGVVATLLEPVRALGVTATPAGPDWIDVTPLGLSKASALEAVRQRLGVGEARTVAVGDGVNDLQMLAWAAHSVAMGQAPTSVREAADEVTGTIAQNGVVPVLRALLRRDLSGA
ncbi:HAD superfamily hydrolase (TIGR01484 family) [Promicromonospora sp. AC04]|uniref:HAD family hydrolase n=1 Tax=Promicromonospora sp. AC04 TaxID=2135723 RepID=UPI000D3F8359|nr:HAD family hydrolase [Promicromonospora sp. AC04]PUB19869.1 HAD superfamily hydrolase (TIGR01484 family) [Promicromonospora sp. AC04]